MNHNSYLFSLSILILISSQTLSYASETREHGSVEAPATDSDRPQELSPGIKKDSYQRFAEELAASKDQIKDWAEAIVSLSRGEGEVEQEHVHSFLEAISNLSKEDLERARQTLGSEVGTGGALRKVVEIFSKLNDKKIEELTDLRKNEDVLVSRIATKIAERKTAEKAFLERAKQIKNGLLQMDARLAKDKPTRTEMGALNDARAKLREDLQNRTEQERLHPDTINALKSYQNALLQEREILNKHLRTAVDREATTYWGHLGDELKRSYLSREGAHNALQAAGMVEGFGMAADLIDSALYASEGKLGDAGLSLASAAPFVGMATPVLRGGKNLAKSIVTTGGAVVSSARDMTKLSAKAVGDDLVTLARKPSGAPAVARVREDSAPLYLVNSKHVAGTEAFREARPRGVGVLPDNHVELYRQAVPSKKGDYWTMDSSGNFHRFETDNNNQTHWSGATSLLKFGKPRSKPTIQNPKPIEWKQVPPEILKHFGF
jgi:hypothetical protein